MLLILAAASAALFSAEILRPKPISITAESADVYKI